MMRSIEFHAMNTTVTLAAEGEEVIAGLYATKLFIDRCEQRFSRFLPGSELTELNASAGSWLPVSDDLMEMLHLSLTYHRETNGLFDPSILPDLKQAGYDRSMDEIRVRGVTAARAVRRDSRPAFREIGLDVPNSRVWLPAGMEIDLGGIAKGWIVEKAARLLCRYVPACAVSAGGDMLFTGRPPGGTGWDVYLEDPRRATALLARLRIPSGAVATSSIVKRSWMYANRVQHHLIDPRTGEPARTDWLSVTVLSPDLLTAEVYAKAILIGGESELPELLLRRSEIAFIAVDPRGNLQGSPQSRDYLYEPASATF